MALLGLALAALIGVSLGLFGGGGSILAVPILVYVAGMETKTAIAASLLVVGATSVVGALQHWRAKNVDVRTALMFGIVSMAGSFAGGRGAAYLTDTFQLTLFAIVMLAASVSMLRSRNNREEGTGAPRIGMTVAAATAVGLLTGVVGVGGGFLIVPALVFFTGIPIRRAVGTSLIVISMNSASGFLAYAWIVEIDWSYILGFTGMAIVGVFAGSAAVPHVPQSVLKRAFAIFLIVVAGFILLQNRAAFTKPRRSGTGTAAHSINLPEKSGEKRLIAVPRTHQIGESASPFETAFR